MPKLSDAERDARRQAVIDGARRAFAKWGYAGATVRRLEEEIGQSRGAIFNWFPDKWALFVAVAADDTARELAEIDKEGDIIDGSTRIGRSALPHLGAYVEAIMLMANDPDKRADWDARNASNEPDELQRWQALRDAGRLRTDVSIEDLALFAGLIWDGLALARTMGLEYSAERLALFAQLLRDAVSPRDGDGGRADQPEA